MVQTDVFQESLATIRRSQNPDGGFSSLSSSDPECFSDTAIPYQTTFVTAHILISLASSGVDGMKDVKDRAAEFLLAQIQGRGSANYWSRTSSEISNKPYPDDLDDTAGVIAAIALHDRSLLTPEFLAKFVQVLLACEVKPGGPYRTWLVPPSADQVWLDIDPVVNANLAFALHLLDIQLEGLDIHLDQVLREGRLVSPYYPHEFSVLAALSRRPTKHSQLIADAIISRRLGSTWGNPLVDSIALASLLRLGNSDGPWRSEVLRPATSGLTDRPYAFCLDPAQKGVKYYCGSSALTAAHVLEAILLSRRNMVTTKVQAKTVGDNIHQAILERVKETIFLLPESLAVTAWEFVSKGIEKDSRRQITLTPFLAASLLGDKSKLVSESVLVELGVASVYGWMAYTLLDDVMDKDQGPDILPLATVFTRQMQHTFDSVLLDNPDFHRWQMQMLDRVDAANAWEISEMRFDAEGDLLHLPQHIPEYTGDWQFVDRSIGHAIGPVGVLWSMDGDVDDAAREEMLSIFSDLIRVRQMHDDAHDWEADLFKGQMNSVGVRVLSLWYEQYPEKCGSSVRVAEVQEEWRKLFWISIVPDYSNSIISRCDAAIRRLEPSRLLVTPQPLIDVFLQIKKGAADALRGRDEMLAFLQAFKP